MNPKAPYKRKILFINKEFQGRMIFNYFILLALGSLVFIAIFSFFSANTLSIVYEDYRLQIGTAPGLLFKEILSTQWLFIVLGGLLICFITLHLTHRVAGPFFRFEKTLDTMVLRDISNEIVLRQKDEGKELALKINRFNAQLSQDLAHIQALCEDIGASVSLLEAGLEKGDIRQIAEHVQEIKQGQENIETRLNEYTLYSVPKGS